MKQVVLANQSLSIELPNTTRLTDGEKALLVLIIKKVKSKNSLTIDEVSDIYQKHVAYGRWYWDFSPDADLVWKNKRCLGQNLSEEQLIKNTRQWFISNLGRLIIKGKLVAIPVLSGFEEIKV